MSVKAIALCWELPTPSKYNDIEIKASHKFVLIAYADHADHAGKNIFPAVATIAKKTGLDERTVQRVTRDLEGAGLLLAEGYGPMGTNKWSLPFSEGGDKLTPRHFVRGDKNSDSLGDIPSGDIPSGDKLTPELKEPEPNINTSNDKDELIQTLQDAASAVLEPRVWAKIKRRLQDDEIVICKDGDTIKVMGLSEKEGQFTEADIYESRYSPYFKRAGMDVEWLAQIQKEKK